MNIFGKLKRNLNGINMPERVEQWSCVYLGVKGSL
jgi:hypothetical protein